MIGSDARYTELETAKELLQELKQLVKSCDKNRGTYETSAIKAIMTDFYNKVVDNARNLHSVFRNGWSCNCSQPHRAMLQLEKRASLGDSDFHALFIVPSPEAAPIENEETSLFIQQDVHISISMRAAERLIPKANEYIRQENPSPDSVGREMVHADSDGSECVLVEVQSEKLEKRKWVIREIRDKARKQLFKRGLKSRKSKTKDESGDVPRVSTAGFQETTGQENQNTTGDSMLAEPSPVASIPKGFITNLCQVMTKRAIAQQSLGWLLDQRRSYHNLFAAKETRISGE